jgi:predicted RNase H-like nuclease (RuvC/YqgF family)
MFRSPAPFLVAIALAALPLAAAAQSYRCVGKDGKKYYGQAVPPQCIGQPTEQLNAQGMVVRRIDAQASAAEQAAKAREAEEKRKRDVILKEESRKNKALLSTYTSEADIELARKRALEENQKAVKETEARVAALKKRQADLKKEMEFFQGKNKPPAKMEQEIKDNAFSISTQENLLAQKQKEVDSINAKYDEDKKRYIELTRGSAK